MKSVYLLVATAFVLTACGGGSGDGDSAAKPAANGATSQEAGANSNASCQGGMTATGNLCAAKPHSPSPVLETM